MSGIITDKPTRQIAIIEEQSKLTDTLTFLDQALPMGGQGPVESRNRREKALLQVCEQEPSPRTAR